MANVTFIDGGQVCRPLTLCDDSVMTTGTGSYHLCVINCAGGHWPPQCRIFLVTGITDIRAIDMRRTLATGRGSVMAGDTVTGERRVVRNG